MRRREYLMLICPRAECTWCSCLTPTLAAEQFFWWWCSVRVWPLDGSMVRIISISFILLYVCVRSGDVMVSAFYTDWVARVPVSEFEHYPGHCVVFLGKTLYCHSASLKSRSINGYRLIVWATWFLEDNLHWHGLASHPGESNISICFML